VGDPRAHYVELDAIRGIAILGVVLSHVVASWMNTVEAPLTIPLLRVYGEDIISFLFFWGSVGLSVFFLLSGYLLTWTEEKRARFGIYSVRSYALRRALRVVPAYYVAILVVVVLWPLSVWGMSISVVDVLMHASFLHSLNPNTISSLDPVWWSLTPEVLFYCLLPFIVMKLPRVSQRLALFGVFALISLAIRLYLYMAQIVPDPANPNFWLVLAATTFYLYLFLAGVLLRRLVEYLNIQPASRLRPQLSTALFLIGAMSIVAVLYLDMKHPTIAMLQGQASWSLLGIPIDLLALVFFASLLLGSPLTRAVFRWRFLAFTGMISYSLFLLHSTVIMVVAIPYFRPVIRYWVIGEGPLVVWAAFSCYTLAILAIAFTVSYFSYRYIESPFLSYKPK
jgi:peptidoglycan/LPS O-acetylase OafA/YrhL